MKTVIFNLADKEYGVDITQVREVVRLRKITPVPDAADFVEGVISLRGKVVTLVNLRRKLGLAKIDPGRQSRIIITEIENRLVGVIVDGVSEVLDLNQESITAPDEALRQAKYLSGIAKINNRIILIVDAAQLLSSEDKVSIDSVFQKVVVRKNE